jgi:hypothetical protein
VSAEFICKHMHQALDAGFRRDVRAIGGK